MQNIHSFGACLKKILSSRDLSILEASRSLGMKSPTSLARILHDEVNIKTLERFYRKLLDSSAFSITEEEAGLLTKALKIQQLGQDEYLVRQALWKLLLPMEDEPTEDMKIICYHRHPGSRFDTLSQLFSFYQACSRVNLTVTGCCVPAFTLPLARLLKSSKESRHIFATHYLRSHAGASHSMAATLASLRPLLPLFNYSAFLADRATLPPEAMAVYGKNEFLCSFTDSQGKQRWHHGQMMDSGRMMLMEYRCEANYAFHADSFSRYHALLAPLKPRFFSTTQPEGYADYIRYFQQLEHDKEIYAIKPDLPIYFIHPDLLLCATLEALPESPFENEVDGLLRQMYAIQLQRWKNIFKKRKMTHIIFSFKAMQEFARTGVQTDHFFGMRPFTPDERRSILTFLRRQMQENPYFNIHFAADDHMPFQLEICGYEQCGVLLSSTTTSYNLSNEYMDAMISQQDFFKTYKSFFLNEFLPSRVHPAKETVALLDQVIDAIPPDA